MVEIPIARERPTCHTPLKRVLPALILGAALALAGCAAPGAPQEGASISLPLRTGWVDGLVVRYITTDVSDAQLALEKGANHAPRLADATRGPADSRVLERVYVVVGSAQPPVFQSAPKPVGPRSADTSYSPLWRMTLVTWKQHTGARELRSEQDILDAEDQGLLSIVPTDKVLNCPILSVEGRGTLPGVRW